MRYTYEVNDISRVLSLFFDLRGIQEFDGNIIVDQGEHKEQWIGDDIVLSALSLMDKREVFVHGDYDTDGVSSIAIAKSYSDNFSLIIPSRKWGYGLTERSVQSVKDGSVLITADCGISGAEQIEQLSQRGIDVIVTDHHALPSRLPRALVVHPQLLNSDGFTGYSGSGVLYKFFSALYGSDNEAAIQFAAIGTITDMVPVLHENRVIIRNGIRLIRENPDYRIAALCQAAKRDCGRITPNDISFYIGPIINSCSRLNRIDVLYDWVNSDRFSALLAAREMVNINELRKQAIEKTKTTTLLDDNVVVCLSTEDAASTLGLIANSLLSSKRKPVVVCAPRGEGFVCSVRSGKYLDASKMVESLGKNISVSGGGHPGAAGFAFSPIKHGDVSELVEAIKEYGDLHVTTLSGSEVTVDFWIDIEQIPTAKRVFSRLVPFGVGLEAPTFGTIIYPQDCKILGKNKNHVRIKHGDVDVLFFSVSEKEIKEIMDSFALAISAEIDFSENAYGRGTSLIARHWETL